MITRNKLALSFLLFAGSIISMETDDNEIYTNVHVIPEDYSSRTIRASRLSDMATITVGFSYFNDKFFGSIESFKQWPQYQQLRSSEAEKLFRKLNQQIANQ